MFGSTFSLVHRLHASRDDGIQQFGYPAESVTTARACSAWSVPLIFRGSWILRELALAEDPHQTSPS